MDLQEDILDILLDHPSAATDSRLRDNSVSKRPKNSLVCVVCGDHAFGYNFDAISCESCKAFFRRNALRPPNDLRCRDGGHCPVTVETRKRCKKCRLDKCFRMGMRKEWILTDEDKLRKRRKVEENRHRRRHQSQSCTNCLARRSDDRATQSNVRSNSLMTPADWTRIQQVQTAYTEAIALNKVIGVPPYPAVQPIHSTLDLLRIPTYLASIRLISFIKKMPEIAQFHPEDRVTLVKYNLLAVVLTHSILLYDPIADTYHEYNTEDPIFQGRDWIEILGEHFYHQLTSIATKLIEVVYYDRIIIKIFLLLILTSKGFCAYDIEHEPTLNNHSIVIETQHLYLTALYKYCIHHYGLSKTILLFSRSINQFLAIQHSAVHLKDFVHHQPIDVSQLSPLLQTVLQLDS